MCLQNPQRLFWKIEKKGVTHHHYIMIHNHDSFNGWEHDDVDANTDDDRRWPEWTVSQADRALTAARALKVVSTTRIMMMLRMMLMMMVIYIL